MTRPISNLPNSFAGLLLEQVGKHLAAHENADASSLVDQALGIDPKNIRGLSFTAVLAARAGQKDRALKLIAHALKLGPTAPVVIYNAAAVFFRCGQPHRARVLWERLSQLLPRSVLMDADRFTRQAETAYCGMWHKWCAATRPR